MSKKSTTTNEKTSSKRNSEQKKGSMNQHLSGKHKEIRVTEPEMIIDDTEIQSASEDIENKLTKNPEEIEQEVRDMQDKYLRLSAEFDNYRKRTLREKADLLRFANEDILKSILPLIDDFERGIDNIDKAQDIEALRAGVHLIYNKFKDFIKQNGIKEIEAMEQLFNIDFHEAMTNIPAPAEDLKGKVVDVLEKGYLLNDKVIRYAKVIVGE
jgi:molecular chaperone GrpE